VSKWYSFATSIRLANLMQATNATKLPIMGPTQYTHHPFHTPDMIPGPKLLAGFVLVPDLNASNGTIKAKRTEIIRGVNRRRLRNAKKKHSPATRPNVVTTSPTTAAEVL